MKLKKVLVSCFFMLVISSTVVSAKYYKEIEVLKTIKVLENKEINPKEKITRENLARYITKLIKISVPSKKQKLFLDTENKYINAVVKNDLMYGYSNMKFYPKRYVKVKDIAYSFTKILGYKDIGYLERKEIFYKLNKNFKKDYNSYITYQDFSKLSVNLINAKKLDGSSLLVELDLAQKDLKLDQDKVIKGEIKGPYLIDELPIDINKSKIYKNGKLILSSNLEKYDVLYYKTSNDDVFVYDDKITGIIKDILPNLSSPMEIVISGTTYKLDQSKNFDFSLYSNIRPGEYVTCLLNKQNEVSYILKDYYNSFESSGGIILESKRKYDDNSNDVNTILTILTADGGKNEIIYDGKPEDFKKNDVVRISKYNGKFQVKKMELYQNYPVFGKVDDNITRIGNSILADNIRVLEYNENYYNKVNKNMLKGLNLQYSDILYYGSNSNGEINEIILKGKNVNKKYGILLEREYIYDVNLDDTKLKLKFDFDGNFEEIIAEDIQSAVIGPVSFDGKKCEVLKLLDNPKYSEGYYIDSNRNKYKIDAGIKAYIKDNKDYILVPYGKLINDNKYDVYVYYDSTPLYGEVARIVIAIKK